MKQFVRLRDITHLVEFQENDGESLPLTKCVCGEKFEAWNFILGVYQDTAQKCICGRRLYFSNNIRVYEVVEEGTSDARRSIEEHG